MRGSVLQQATWKLASAPQLSGGNLVQFTEARLPGSPCQWQQRAMEAQTLTPYCQTLQTRWASSLAPSCPAHALSLIGLTTGCVQFEKNPNKGAVIAWVSATVSRLHCCTLVGYDSAVKRLTSPQLLTGLRCVLQRVAHSLAAVQRRAPLVWQQRTLRLTLCSNPPYAASGLPHPALRPPAAAIPWHQVPGMFEAASSARQLQTLPDKCSLQDEKDDYAKDFTYVAVRCSAAVRPFTELQGLMQGALCAQEKVISKLPGLK